MIAENPTVMTDSYKISHWRQHQDGTLRLGSYFEARAGGEYPEVVFFGMQYLLKRYIAGLILKQEHIEEGEEFARAHFGRSDVFNGDGWRRLLEKHQGIMPLRIKAVPEGSVIPESNVLFTIENTDNEFPWLVNHFETLLVQLWYPCTVATISRALKEMLRHGLAESGTPGKLPFMLHDFGYRGSTSVESAAIGDAAHLVNFMGTDTIAGIEMLRQYYGADMPGFSVPAAEHSTITSWGQDREADAYRHIINQFNTGLVSVVSDSWDIYQACRQIWGRILRDEIREKDGLTVVVRPDSGEPRETVVNCLNILGEQFGFTRNPKGYKVLPDCIRLIQGDGINRHSLPALVEAIMTAGWSLDNIAFGSGGGLLQDCNRDTQRFGLKCNWIDVNGVIKPVSKNPQSDVSKSSKAGPLKLVTRPESKTNRLRGTVGVSNNYQTVSQDEPGEDIMQVVFENGELVNETSLTEIRKRLGWRP